MLSCHALEEQTSNKQKKKKKGSLSITKFLFLVKQIVDELSVLDNIISNDDMTFYVLNGLGLEYHHIAASIHNRDHPFTFEKLHSHLVVAQ